MRAKALTQRLEEVASNRADDMILVVAVARQSGLAPRSTR